MKHYLIDSENVGDFWIPLLELPADQAELIVFYTKNSLSSNAMRERTHWISSSARNLVSSSQ